MFNKSVKGYPFCVALLLVLFTEAYITTIYFKFIIHGYGLGVYAVYLYVFVLTVSSFLWFLSHRKGGNSLQAKIFWSCALLLMPIVIFQPIWWSAPLIN
jgi:hypothetical protein